MSFKKDRSSLQKLVATIVTITVTLVLAGCSKSSNPVSSGQSSTVEGQVSGQPGLAKNSSADGGIQGAAVTLAQIQADGSLKTVSTGSVQTDATGRFSVNTNLSGVSNLVVVASQGSTQWKAVVSSEVKNGTTVYCQPLTNQTTVQAETYSKVVADGKGDEVTPADLQLFVNASVAANVSGNASATSQLAAALEAESEARASAFSQFNVTQVEIQSAETAREQAQVSLESSLYTAAGDSAAEYTALQSYYAATVGAYVTAGVPIAVLAKTEQTSCSALTNFSAAMSAGAEFSVQQSAALIRAAVIGQAVLSEMQAGGASQAEFTSAESANTALQASLSLAVSSNDISTAFANYHALVLAQLEAMDGTSGSAVAKVDGDIYGSGGAQAILQASLSVATTTGAVVQAYVTFYNTVGTMMQGMSGMSSAQLDASTQILMLIDANA